MKAKTLAMTAIICGASFLGINFTAAYAASLDTVTNIESSMQTEQLSKKVRDRNRAIGIVLGIAAIAAIANNNKHRDDNYERGSQRGRSGGRHDRNTPPPPPMPYHHHR